MGANRVAIGGFMATGKSTTGRLLATRLGLEFIDLDRAVELHAQKSIQDIFKQDGEEAFRRIESLVLRDIGQGGPHVVALGGGTLHQPSNTSILRRYRILVLHTSLLEIQKRLAMDKAERPLSIKAEQLYRQRWPGYRRYGTLLDIEGKMPRQVVDMMFSALKDELL